MGMLSILFLAQLTFFVMVRAELSLIIQELGCADADPALPYSRQNQHPISL
jgi:hypothetical protein